MHPATVVPPIYAARKRPQRRRRHYNWFAYPFKIASVASIGALCAWLMFVFCAKALHPYLLGYSGDHEIAVMRQQLALQSRQNEALQKRVDFLQTPEGVESAARSSGFHKTGEHVYLLPKDRQGAGSAGN